MGLKRYAEKRAFEVTPEPRPKPARAKRHGPLKFVVQRHDATNLHYDLRLELDGTLKSWAVPKGPSFDPAVKRLAVHVEDHPLAYGDFEGTIPEGQYGAGTVMVWDRGAWVCEDDPAKSYAKGTIKMRLEGERMQGRWTLVRSGRGTKGEPGKEQWLLIKDKGLGANPALTPEAFTASVKTGRTMDEITRGAPAHPVVAAPAARSAPPAGATPSSFPKELKVQLATPAASPPSGPGWFHEVKCDGYRFLVYKRGDKVRMVTRRGNDWSERFPHVCRAVGERFETDAVIDGELVVLDTRGISDFQALQNAMKGGRAARSVFIAFDLLWHDGMDLTRAALRDRKAALRALLGDRQEGRLRFGPHFEGEGPAVLRQAYTSGLEGIVSKRADAPYTPGRGPAWIKAKCVNRQEFVIGGYTPPEGSRDAFGALILGYYDGGRLVHCGRVGTGFTVESLKRAKRELDARRTPECPFAVAPSGPDYRGALWVRPELVAEVQFARWTSDGVLREPSFRGLREDRDPKDVRREESVADTPPAPPAPPRTPAATKATAAAPSTRLTSPDRVLYPAEGVNPAITKRQLAEYFEAVAPWMLPHVADRPLAIVRCPAGIGGETFFQKHRTKGMPDAIGSVAIEEEGTKQEHLMVRDAEGLAAMAQISALEIHPWGARGDKPDLPDRVVFDLDPGPDVPWRQVVESARLVRDAMKDLKLTPFVRTTGGKGLHVVVPIERRHTWERVTAFARAVSETLARMAPTRFTASLSKAARPGKIYVDYLRNTRGATAVGSYSPRARPGATVATPLDWDEVTSELSPAVLTVMTVPARLKALGRDPWAEIGQAAGRLPAMASEGS